MEKKKKKKLEPRKCLRNSQSTSVSPAQDYWCSPTGLCQSHLAVEIISDCKSVTVMKR